MGWAWAWEKLSPNQNNRQQRDIGELRVEIRPTVPVAGPARRPANGGAPTKFFGASRRIWEMPRRARSSCCCTRIPRLSPSRRRSSGRSPGSDPASTDERGSTTSPAAWPSASAVLGGALCAAGRRRMTPFGWRLVLVALLPREARSLLPVGRDDGYRRARLADRRRGRARVRPRRRPATAGPRPDRDARAR